MNKAHVITTRLKCLWVFDINNDKRVLDAHNHPHWPSRTRSFTTSASVQWTDANVFGSSAHCKTVCAQIYMLGSHRIASHRYTQQTTLWLLSIPQWEYQCISILHASKSTLHLRNYRYFLSDFSGKCGMQRDERWKLSHVAIICSVLAYGSYSFSYRLRVWLKSNKHKSNWWSLINPQSIVAFYFPVEKVKRNSIHIKILISCKLVFCQIVFFYYNIWNTCRKNFLIIINIYLYFVVFFWIFYDFLEKNVEHWLL